MVVEQLNNLEFNNIRFEVIDKNGRQVVENKVDIVMSSQDEGKTLKIFIK